MMVILGYIKLISGAQGHLIGVQANPSRVRRRLKGIMKIGAWKMSAIHSDLGAHGIGYATMTVDMDLAAVKKSSATSLH
jgi:hypothetical protein